MFALVLILGIVIIFLLIGLLISVDKGDDIRKIMFDIEKIKELKQKEFERSFVVLQNSIDIRNFIYKMISKKENK